MSAEWTSSGPLSRVMSALLAVAFLTNLAATGDGTDRHPDDRRDFRHRDRQLATPSTPLVTVTLAGPTLITKPNGAHRRRRASIVFPPCRQESMSSPSS